MLLNTFSATCNMFQRAPQNGLVLQTCYFDHKKWINVLRHFFSLIHVSLFHVSLRFLCSMIQDVTLNWNMYQNNVTFPPSNSFLFFKSQANNLILQFLMEFMEKLKFTVVVTGFQAAFSFIRISRFVISKCWYVLYFFHLKTKNLLYCQLLSLSKT